MARAVAFYGIVPAQRENKMVPFLSFLAIVLGVATGTYWMFCFFNLISPVMTVLYGLMNIRIRRYSKEEMEAIKAEKSRKV